MQTNHHTVLVSLNITVFEGGKREYISKRRNIRRDDIFETPASHLVRLAAEHDGEVVRARHHGYHRLHNIEQANRHITIFRAHRSDLPVIFIGPGASKITRQRAKFGSPIAMKILAVGSKQQRKRCNKVEHATAKTQNSEVIRYFEATITKVTRARKNVGVTTWLHARSQLFSVDHFAPPRDRLTVPTLDRTAPFDIIAEAPMKTFVTSCQIKKS